MGETKKSENRRGQYIPSQREFADAKQGRQSQKMREGGILRH